MGLRGRSSLCGPDHFLHADAGEAAQIDRADALETGGAGGIGIEDHMGGVARQAWAGQLRGGAAE